MIFLSIYFCACAACSERFSRAEKEECEIFYFRISKGIVIFTNCKMAAKNVISVLDFSGSFSPERALFPERIEGTWAFSVSDFRDLDGTMCFCSEESAAEIRRRLGVVSALPADCGGTLREDCPSQAGEGIIHWIDTGDYHYLSYFFLERISVPFTLLLLDNHPDDQPSVFGGDLLSCGGWVLTAMERLSMLRRVVSVGPDGAVTVRERVSGASSGGMDDAWRVIRKADLYDAGGGDSESRVENAYAILSETVSVGENVYLSLDKDVLSYDFARTDWSQGELTLSGILRLIQVLQGRNVLGVDICGGLTEAKGASVADFSVNARTDAALLDALGHFVSREALFCSRRRSILMD